MHITLIATSYKGR